ncbi:hypothetical protein FBZ92_1288 [Nitrospirillum viridazoti]|uniref:Metalloprotease with PDZ domain n=2 Tax=Nitrospirillum TaxID=1543705 RepID=A0A560HQG1_9PROT|nr:hypothetical protein FBZ92_1288 [Nitrospirillum amazonense]
MCGTVPAMAQSSPQVDVKLTPIASDGSVTTVRVIETLTGLEGGPDRPLVSVPARIALTPGQAYAAEEVVFADAAGPLSVRMDVDQPPPGMPLQMRSFTPLRAIAGPVTVTYAAKVTPALTPRKPGPSYDLRGVEGGIGGAYFSFLLMPLQVPQVDVHLAWDVADLPQGASVISTAGGADYTARLAPMDVYSTFFLVGRVHGLTNPGSPFQAYWIGTPPFKADAMVDWSRKSFTVLQRFFQDPDAKPYTLLMRPYLRPRDGGGATRGGFMLEYGVGALDDAARRIMFTHEMVHHFVGGLDGDSSANAWYGEGLAEFYKVRLPLREGLLHIVDVAREIGIMTNAYYSSPLVTTPYAEVGKLRWAGGEAQSVPYNRGFMYFINLDAKVRAKSGGHRSVDDLVLAMLERRRAGRPYDKAAWRALLQQELGAAGGEDFDRMLRGDLIVPPEGAFGDCFTRHSATHPRSELGMSEDSFLVAPYTVTGLVPDSAAARAGLKEGDAITSFTGVTPRVAHSAANVTVGPTVDVVVEREGKPLLVSFATAGAPMVEYSWTLKTKHPAGCVL